MSGMLGNGQRLRRSVEPGRLLISDLCDLEPHIPKATAAATASWKWEGWVDAEELEAGRKGEKRPAPPTRVGAGVLPK